MYVRITGLRRAGRVRCGEAIYRGPARRDERGDSAAERSAELLLGEGEWREIYA